MVNDNVFLIGKHDIKRSYDYNKRQMFNDATYHMMWKEDQSQSRTMVMKEGLDRDQSEYYRSLVTQRL